MATNYPTGLDALTNPTSSDTLASVDHAAQHTNVNDAIEAIQAELGLDPAGTYATVRARLDNETSVGLELAMSARAFLS